jgi:protein gp37
MNKSKIEWTYYSLNPVKGLCPMACSYCYARRMYKRYHWNETIQYDNVGYHKNDWGISTIKKPSKIFVGSTMELFGDWVSDTFRSVMFQVCRRYPQHTFIFLTKQPQNIIKWSPYPRNCWVGVSATNEIMFHNAVSQLALVNASVKFISIEPLLESVNVAWVNPEVIQWLIIGQQTPVSKKTSPKVEWIREIVDAADKAKIPVFLKNNMEKLLPLEAPFKTNPNGAGEWWLRQEYPVTSREE